MSTAIAKRKQGRPTTFTQEMADTICERIAEGFPLATMCREPGMPAWRTVYQWQEAHPEFYAAIARARVSGYDRIAAECLEIANSPLEGVEVTEKGDGTVETKRGDMLGHRKLQIETRLKLLAKWDPRRYGELTRIEVDDVTDRSAQIAEARKRAIGG